LKLNYILNLKCRDTSGAVAYRLVRWTYNQQVVGLTPGHCIARQQRWAERSHTCPVPLKL